MKDARDVTIVTDRGQVSIPSHLRRELELGKGKRILWRKVSDHEILVTILAEGRAPGGTAMRGFARRFRPEPRRTADWMKELREGEKP